MKQRATHETFTEILEKKKERRETHHTHAAIRSREDEEYRELQNNVCGYVHGCEREQDENDDAFDWYGVGGKLSFVTYGHLLSFLFVEKRMRLRS